MKTRFASLLLTTALLFSFAGAEIFGAGQRPHKGQSPGVKPLQEIRKAEKANKKPQVKSKEERQKEREQKVKKRRASEKERQKKQNKAGQNRKKELNKREKINREEENASQR